MEALSTCQSSTQQREATFPHLSEPGQGHRQANICLSVWHSSWPHKNEQAVIHLGVS